MKFYVASAFGNKAAVREMQGFLRSIGHTITHDWTGEDIAGRTGDDLTQYIRRCAVDDAVGVRRADVLVALNDAKGCGLWWECGIALAIGVPIIIVSKPGDPWTIFMDLPDVYRVTDEVGVLNALEQIASRKLKTWRWLGVTAAEDLRAAR